MTPLIVVARGSRDPAALRSIWALTGRVAAQRPGSRVKAAFIAFEAPDLCAAICKEAGLAYRQAVVVPLLLTAGRAARLAVPQQVEAARDGGLSISVSVAEVLGPVGGAAEDRRQLELIVAALLRQLRQAPVTHTGRHSASAPFFNRGSRPDAIVLAAAGSGSTRAMSTAALVARSLSAAAGVPCQVGYTSAGVPTVAEAISEFTGRGAQTVATASYLLTPGVLYQRISMASFQAGAVAISAPLCEAPEIVELILLRADAAMA